LEDELDAAGVVGICGIDTRALTRHLRDAGAMRVGVSSVEWEATALHDRVIAAPSMLGADLAREVSTPEPYVVPAVGTTKFTVVAVDLGIKAMTPHRMAQRGIDVHVVPASYSAADVLALDPDGVFLSNGPGDPGVADYAVDLSRGVLDARVPLFGICFGNQILAARWASAPTSCASVTGGSTSRSWTAPRARWRSRRTTTASPWTRPGRASPRRRTAGPRSRTCASTTTWSRGALPRCAGLLGAVPPRGRRGPPRRRLSVRPLHRSDAESFNYASQRGSRHAEAR